MQNYRLEQPKTKNTTQEIESSIKVIGYCYIVMLICVVAQASAMCSDRSPPTTAYCTTFY